MINATYQLYNSGFPEGEPFTMSFADAADKLRWENEDEGHPLLEHIEIKDASAQAAIIKELGVKPTIVPQEEAERRVKLLADYLRDAAARALVLGISGGVDSTVAGRLCQLAVEDLRAKGYDSKFVAVRLPYHVQRDEADAQKALAFMKPDVTTEINIGHAAEAMLFEVHNEIRFKDMAHEDFVMGNIKARMRMVGQYAIAGAVNGLVVGTDHASEAVMGFFTKFGDGAADICPLSGLTKDQVRQIGEFLKAPDELVNKVPTADLESLNPGKPDEEAFGIPYDDVNAFLKGEKVPAKSEKVIIDTYVKTMHKRKLPVTL